MPKIDFEIKEVHTGQIATYELDGTFHRGPVPCRGFIIETMRRTIFFSFSKMRELLGGDQCSH
jgi:hypothetical protein